MQLCRMSLLVASLFAFSAGLSGTNALAATPFFTITATNVMMSSSSSSGTGSSSFTLTSVNGYTGQIHIGCNSPTPPEEVKVPFCGSWAVTGAAIPVQPPINLTANEVVTGTFSFINAPEPCSNPCPVSLPRQRGHGLAQGLALAGALLLGFGLRRKARPWLKLTLFTLCAFFLLAEMGACGGNNSVVTPGAYAYAITATDVNTAATVSSSVQVTVP